jgi:hypothetical protein
MVRLWSPKIQEKSFLGAVISWVFQAKSPDFNSPLSFGPLAPASPFVKQRLLLVQGFIIYSTCPTVHKG